MQLTFDDSNIVYELEIEALLNVSAYDFTYKNFSLGVFGCNTCTLIDMKL